MKRGRKSPFIVSLLSGRLMQKKLQYLLPSLFFFLGVPIVWILCFREVPLIVSSKTTHITSPLIPGGKQIDWLRAIKERFEPKCDPKDNGFRMIVETLGKSPYFDEPDWYWPELCKAFDLDPNMTPIMQFEPPDEFIKRNFRLWTEENEEQSQKLIDKLNSKYPAMSPLATDTEKLNYRLTSEAWTPDEFPFMKRWIEENIAFLDLVAEAVRKEFYFEPKLRNPHEKPESLDCGTAYGARILELRIPDSLNYRFQYYIGTKNIDKAWQDAMSISYLRIHHNFFFPTDDYFTVHARSVLKNGVISDEQRKRFMNDLDRLPKRYDVKERIERWRYSSIRNVQIYCETDFNKPFLPLNWNVVARWHNRVADDFERTVDVLDAETDEAKRRKIIDDSKSRYATPPKRSWLGNWLGKPITIRERSLDYAWTHEQFYILNYHIPSFLLRQEEVDLQEFRKELENGKNSE